MKPIPLCSNCLSILNIYGGCDKCNKALIKVITESRGRMNKIVIDKTQWPGGISLDIGTDSFQTTIAGPHGGGVGHTIKRFLVDADKLIAAIDKYRGEEEE